MIRVTWHGHATVSLDSNGHSLLIDPFLEDNPVAVTDPASLNPDFVLITHGHADHVADARAILERTGAKLISTPEITDWFGSQGIDNAHAMNIGGFFGFDFGRLKLTPAWHSNSLPDGSYGGMPTGLLIEMDGRRIYHAGDTGLFSDMKLIGQGGIDLAFLPIGSNFTMGPEEAVQAAEFLGARTVVPIHYNTFPPIKQDPEAFRRQVEDRTGTACLIPEPGKPFEF